MSGRGRGGRGGRGGVSKTFNREQLNALGIVGNEVLPGPVNQPPPLYPLLDRKPVPLTTSMETDYLLILKQDFIDHLQLSASYLKLPEGQNSQPDLEIDKLIAQLPSVKEKYDWKLFPSELRPKVLAKRRKPPQKSSTVNIEETLKKFEKLEEKSDDTKIKEKSEEVAEFDDIEEEQDEEMDDGTDYANNYFDNGEDYEDEDDNLEDDPIF